MTTLTAAAYSSDHPDVLAWLQETKKVRQAFNAAVRAFMITYDLDQDYLPTIRSFWGRREFLSISKRAGADCPFGWRENKWPSGGFVPDKRTKVGKEAAKWIEAIKEKMPAPPGSLDTIVVGDHWYYPGYRELGGRVWMLWTTDPTGPDADAGFNKRAAIDPGLWRREPLSAYYLLAEGVA